MAAVSTAKDAAPITMSREKNISQEVLLITIIRDMKHIIVLQNHLIQRF